MRLPGTCIGNPFAIQHLKLAGLSLAPFGKTVVVAPSRRAGGEGWRAEAGWAP